MNLVDAHSKRVVTQYIAKNVLWSKNAVIMGCNLSFSKMPKQNKKQINNNHVLYEIVQFNFNLT